MNLGGLVYRFMVVQKIHEYKVDLTIFTSQVHILLYFTYLTPLQFTIYVLNFDTTCSAASPSFSINVSSSLSSSWAKSGGYQMAYFYDMLEGISNMLSEEDEQEKVWGKVVAASAIATGLMLGAVVIYRAVKIRPC